MKLYFDSNDKNTFNFFGEERHFEEERREISIPKRDFSYRLVFCVISSEAQRREKSLKTPRHFDEAREELKISGAKSLYCMQKH